MEPREIAIRLLAALAFGGAIGIERQSRHRPAGLRTHILVSLGAALIMCLAEAMFVMYRVRYGYSFDPTRLGAQVISGIGFLGAGTIIHLGVNVKGLTTAASLWTVGCVGLACGAGFYWGAAIVTALVLLTLVVLNKLSNRIDSKTGEVELLLTLQNSPEAMGRLFTLLAEKETKFADLEYTDGGAPGMAVRTLTITLLLESGYTPAQASADISALEGVLGLQQAQRHQ